MGQRFMGELNLPPDAGSSELHPAEFLLDLEQLFRPDAVPGPVLDLACGDCHNGLYVGLRGFRVECLDVSAEALNRARASADAYGVEMVTRRVDLEQPGAAPLEKDAYGAVLVFRYLHRALIPAIRRSIRPGGLLVYETFTRAHARFGKPRNPDHLLESGELLRWFRDWEILHWSEPFLDNPPRAVARLACRKPVS
jgi:SAM-dependent methyltransferase